jgi:hypothetical protein
MTVLSLSLVFTVVYVVCLVVFWFAFFEWHVGSVSSLEGDLVDWVGLLLLYGGD